MWVVSRGLRILLRYWEKMPDEILQHPDGLLVEPDMNLAERLSFVGRNAQRAFLSRMQQDVLLVVAEQNARCQTAADAKCEELRRDKLNANWRVSELESAGPEQAQRNADLESELSRERAEKSAIAKELEAVRSELRRSEQEVGIVDRLFSEIRDPAVHADIRKMLAEVARDQNAALAS